MATFCPHSVLVAKDLPLRVTQKQRAKQASASGRVQSPEPILASLGIAQCADTSGHKGHF